MKKVNKQILKFHRLKNFNLLLALSIVLIFVVTVIAIVVGILVNWSIMVAIPVAFMPLISLLYLRLYLYKCEICLDWNSRTVIVTKPFSTKSVDFCDAQLLIRRIGFIPSYVVTILDASGKKMIKFEDSVMDNVQSIMVLPKSPKNKDYTVKAFRKRWK